MPIFLAKLHCIVHWKMEIVTSPSGHCKFVVVLVKKIFLLSTWFNRNNCSKRKLFVKKMTGFQRNFLKKNDACGLSQIFVDALQLFGNVEGASVVNSVWEPYFEKLYFNSQFNSQDNCYHCYSTRWKNRVVTWTLETVHILKSNPHQKRPALKSHNTL